MDYRRPPQEPPQIYGPTTILHETSPTMITPLSKLGMQPEQTDCPYCEKVVETEVREIDSENSGQVFCFVCWQQRVEADSRESMMQCLICLVCWPLLFCYTTDKDIIHMCKLCKRQLTVKRHGSNEVTVVASARQEQSKVPSAYQ